MARKLRPALDIVSDIGALGFDLQHHSDEQIADAVALLRTVNPEMFDWLVRSLSQPRAIETSRPAVLGVLAQYGIHPAAWLNQNGDKFMTELLEAVC